MPHPDVRISVRDFGPIVEADVDLRPLTVFVGPSNTGKTYLATLIYALHKASDGFARMLPGAGFITQRLRAIDAGTAERFIEDARKKLLKPDRPFTWRDIPEPVRDGLRDMLASVANDLQTDLARCFDIENCSELVRSEGSGDRLRISLDRREAERRLWHVNLNISKLNGVEGGDGDIDDDLVLVEAETPQAARRDLVSARRRDSGALFGDLIERAGWAGKAPQARHLPAARGGILETYRVIASSLVRRSTRVGLKRAAELPTLSGITVDFMDCLMLYEEGKAGRQETRDLADALEQDPLGGEIRVRRPFPDGLPEFVYRPRGTTLDIGSGRASSMVNEIAPVVLFLRGILDPGDTLIVEELEAHLHPAAQTRMAVALAGLVRAGVRVVVTTHSDWLLKELGKSDATGRARQGRCRFDGGSGDTELAGARRGWCVAVQPAEGSIGFDREGTQIRSC